MCEDKTISKDEYTNMCLPIQNEVRMLRESGHIAEAKEKERSELAPIVNKFYLTYYTNPVVLVNHGCDKAERI